MNEINAGQLLKNIEGFCQFIAEQNQKSSTPVIYKESDEIIRFFNTQLNIVFSDKFSHSQYTHYFQLFTAEYDDRNSLSFVNGQKELQSDDQKASLWFILELKNKSIWQIFEIIKINYDFMNCYKENSLLKVNIDNISKNLSQIQDLEFQVTGSFCSLFEDYEKSMEEHLAKFSQVAGMTSLEQKLTEADLNSTNQQKPSKQNLLQPQINPQKSQQQLKANNNTQAGTGNSLQIQKDNQQQQQQEKVKILKREFSMNFFKIRESKIDQAYNIINSFQKNQQKNENDTNEQDQDQSLQQIAHSFIHQQKQEKRSELLFKRKYKQISDEFQYSPKPDKQKTLAEQNNQCQNCQKEIRSSILFLTSNAYLCNFYLCWYCQDCISKEKRPIPWRVQENFDCRQYRVSKMALTEIDKFYDKPIIFLDYKSPIIYQNKRLADFMILKRSLHLMFNMICSESLSQLLAVIDERANFCLKENLFSLKNLYEISNESNTQILSHFIQKLQTHIYRCKVCGKKGFVCKICNNPAVKVFVFDLQNSFFCNGCKTLYHKNCYEINGCPNCKVGQQDEKNEEN